MKKIVTTIQATVERTGDGEIKLTCGFETPHVEGLGSGPEAINKLMREGDIETFVAAAVAKRLFENMKNAKDVMNEGLEDAVQEGIGAHKGLCGLREGVLPVIGAAIADAIYKAIKKDEAKPDAAAETPTPADESPTPPDAPASMTDELPFD